MSLFATAFFGTVPFGSLFAGAMAERFGSESTIAFGGAACILGSLLFLRTLPELQRLARPVYVRLGILQDEPPS